jgi:hypothetical protein
MLPLPQFVQLPSQLQKSSSLHDIVMQHQTSPLYSARPMIVLFQENSPSFVVFICRLHKETQVAHQVQLNPLGGDLNLYEDPASNSSVPAIVKCDCSMLIYLSFWSHPSAYIGACPHEPTHLLPLGELTFILPCLST